VFTRQSVAMSQDNWQIVASHLGILMAGGTVMFLDTTLPDALISHMLNDAQPVVTLTRGQGKIRDPADARCPDVAGEDTPKRTAALAGRPHAAPCDYLAHLLKQPYRWRASRYVLPNKKSQSSTPRFGIASDSLARAWSPCFGGGKNWRSRTPRLSSETRTNADGCY
jgi:acyl-CoA synthetase (AMP-forming)/AMP-acid ligase II